MPPSTSFYDLVPPGWLKEYLSAMREAKNEMPLPFHFLSAACIIGQMLGLRVWATLGKGVRVYPNINVMLLSPAGQCRRGEGTKIAERVARGAGVNVLSGKFTAEGLADELMDCGDTLVYVEELSMLFTKQEHQRPLIPALTKLLLHGEGPADLRTRQMGAKRSIPYVNLSALFTSAPDWFMTTIPEEAFGGGMMSRFLVCCLQQRDVFDINIQADDAAATEATNKLIRGLIPIRKTLNGHVIGTNEAQMWIYRWYLANETAILPDERLGPHRNRKPANLLRIALILSAAAGRTEPVLQLDMLQAAAELLDWLEPTLHQLYGITEELSQSVSKTETRILKCITRGGGALLHSDLVRSTLPYFKDSGGIRGLHDCLEGMIEKGLIEPKYKHGVVRWPPQSWHLMPMGVKEGGDECTSLEGSIPSVTGVTEPVN